MKRVFLTCFVILTVAASPTVLAKKDKGGAAGPDPEITVSTVCVRNIDGNEVTKFFAEGSPSRKNELLAEAIGIADFQTTCDGPSVAKDFCEVTRTTPGGVEQFVYLAERPDCE